MRRSDPTCLYLTGAEIYLRGGSMAPVQMEHPLRAVIFDELPVNPSHIRSVNRHRQALGYLRLPIFEGALRLEHNLFMKIDPLKEDGETARVPVFLRVSLGENGKPIVSEDPELTRRIYDMIDVYVEDRENVESKEEYRRIQERR